MNVKRYRKKPVVIEAMQLIGPDDVYSIVRWITAGGGSASGNTGFVTVSVKTLEGVMRADRGDWIIRGVQGEYYPCKPEIFDATYEGADS